MKTCMTLLMTMIAGESFSEEIILELISPSTVLQNGLKIQTGNFHTSITCEWCVLAIPEFYHAKYATQELIRAVLNAFLSDQQIAAYSSTPYTFKKPEFLSELDKLSLLL